MSKIILIISFVSICATQAQAQLLSGCAMANGDLVHKVSNVDGELRGWFDFPSFRNYRKDPTGQTRSLNAPLSNDNFFADRIAFTKEKQVFLEKLFGENFNLQLTFDSCELQQSADKKLSARFCFKRGPIEINGVKLNRIDFSIQNQIRTSLTGSEGQTKDTEVVYADLLFTTAANAGGIIKAYRSSFSYFPNGDSVQCSLYSSTF